MRSSVILLAAIVTMSVASYTISASAETVVVHHGVGWHPYHRLYNSAAPGPIVTHRAWHSAPRDRVIVR